MSDAAIDVRGLYKSFGRQEVLKGIQLTIRPGLVTAVVGHNGAGKTTLIKSILGLVKPDRGEIHVQGRPIGSDATYRRHIGYMPQAARFPENLRLREWINMLKDVRQDCPVLDEELLELLGLAKEMDKPFKALSGGTRQKAAAMVAMLFNPDILILDEPTAGLDPVASVVFKDKIVSQKQKGRTIVLTSHVISDLEELADHIVFLVEGVVHYEGSVTAILEKFRSKNLERAMAQMIKGIEVWTALQKS